MGSPVVISPTALGGSRTSGGARLQRLAPYLIAVLLSGAIAWIHLHAGGTRLIFAIPGYAGIAAAGVLSLLCWRQSVPALDQSCLVSATLFFGYLLARTVFSPLPYLARTNLYLVLAALIVYFLTALHLTSVRHRLVVLIALFLLGIGHLVVGAIQFARSSNFLPADLERPLLAARASGFYISPDHFAGFLECMALLALALAFFGRMRIAWRIICAYLSVLALMGILISGSRGAYWSAGLALCGLLAFAAVHFRKCLPKRSWQIWLVAGAALVVALGSGLIVTTQSRFLDERFASLAEANTGRLQLWQAALKEYQLNPLTGTGSGTYLVYGRKFREVSQQDDSRYVRNDYLQLLAEFGLAGAGLLALFVFLHAARTWQFTRKMNSRLHKRELALSSSLAVVLGAFFALLALATHSIVDYNLQVPATVLVAAFLFGVLANPGIQLGRSVLPRRWRPWLLAPPILAVLLLTLALPTWSGETNAENARGALRDQQLALTQHYAGLGLRTELKNPDLYYYLGEARRELGEGFNGRERSRLLQEAAAAFEAGLRLFPMDDRLLVKAALTYAELGDFGRTDQLFAQAFVWSPHLGAIYACYGLCLQLEQRQAEALQAYAQSVRLGSREIGTAGLREIADAAKDWPSPRP